jgi:NADH-ubiquinone oxidoreductase chain 5
LAISVKSAQLPFRVWLPIAIAAPTPISALVHTSTLVTAGIYLLIKNDVHINSPVLILVTRASFLVASLLALMERDFKKIVAFSTISQIRFICFTLGLGLPTLSFIHLLTHAFFKSLMFISVGNLIHQSDRNQQSISLKTKTTTRLVLLQIRVLSLLGLIFSSGAATKHLIFSQLINTNKGFSLVIIVRLIYLTFFYSCRLLSPFYPPISFNKEMKIYPLVIIFCLFVWDIFEETLNISQTPQISFLLFFFSPLIFVPLFFFMFPKTPFYM